METKVQRWGNSLAVRIPKTFADEIGVRESSPIDISLAEGKLVLSPSRRTTFTLEGLLAGVTDENLHDEVETGPAVGDEVW
jgi:antitoxin MazE